MKMCLPWEDEFDEECGEDEDCDDDEDGNDGEDYDDNEEECEGGNASNAGKDSADYAFQERRASSAEKPNQRSYVPWHFGGDGSGCDGI
jgi:hypothetical protein